MPKVFISYRREDSAYVAAAINERFQQRFGDRSVFFDVDKIPLGVDFRDHIDSEVGQCDALLVVIGERWANATDADGERRLFQPSDFVRVEIQSALARNVPVVPVLVDNAVMPASEELPESIRDLSYRNAGEVRAGRDLSDHLDRLIQDVEAILQKAGESESGSRETDRASTDVSSTKFPPLVRKPIALVVLATVIILGVVGAFFLRVTPEESTTVELPAELLKLPAGEVLNILVNGKRPVAQGSNDDFQLRLLISVKSTDARTFQSLNDGESVASLTDQLLMFAQPFSEGYLYVFQIDSSGQVAWFFPRNASSISFGSNPVVANKVIQIPPPNAENQTEAFFLDEQTGIEHVYAVLCAKRWPELESVLAKSIASDALGERSSTNVLPPTIEKPFSLASLANKTRGVGGKVIVESPVDARRLKLVQKGKQVTIPMFGHRLESDGSVLIIERWYRHLAK